jgi:hypothetical protein
MTQLIEEPLNEFIHRRSTAFAKQTAAELATLELDELLRSNSAFWYQSQQDDAADLISKLIETRLTTSDEKFARSVLDELGGFGNQDLYEQAVMQVGKHSKERRRTIDIDRVHAGNRLTREFIRGYCAKSFAIDWQKLVRFVATS